ncbi:type II secretion system protein J [Chloroflexota bacterium]
MDNQRGFTLLELVAGLAISSIILVGATMIILSLYTEYHRDTHRLTAYSELDQAITAIHKDLMHAQEITITEELTSIGWTDYTGNQTEHTVTYAFNGTGSTVVQRTYDGELEIIGRNITDLTFETDNISITVTIASAGIEPEKPNKTVKLNVKMRGETTE